MYKGQLVQLKNIHRDNLESYKRWIRDYEVQRFLAPHGAYPLTDEAEDAWYERASQNDGKMYPFAIHTLEDDQLIGNCSLFAIDQRNRACEFGIMIGEKEYWGKGYGTDATRVMLRFAFDEMNLNRVQLWVFDFNARAIRSYEKVGFTHEGMARQSLFREGTYHDLHLMGIIREDWLKIKAEAE